VLVYTVERAARELGISANNLFNMCLVGEGPVIRRVAPKDRAIILATEFQAWLETRPVIKTVGEEKNEC
jgi:hypothetical protein